MTSPFCILWTLLLKSGRLEVMTTVQVPSKVLTELDSIIQEAHDSKSYDRIESETDWKIVIKLYLFYKRAYPTEYKHFIETMKLMKQGAMNKYASSIKDKKGQGGQVRHICEIPKRFGDWLDIFYPKQSFNKKFLRQLIRRIPDFQVPDNV